MSYDEWFKSFVEPLVNESFPRASADLIKTLVDTAHKKGQAETYRACTEKLKAAYK